MLTVLDATLGPKEERQYVYKEKTEEEWKEMVEDAINFLNIKIKEANYRVLELGYEIKKRDNNGH